MENLKAILSWPYLMFVTIMNTGGRITTGAVRTVNIENGSTGFSFVLFLLFGQFCNWFIKYSYPMKYTPTNTQVLLKGGYFELYLKYAVMILSIRFRSFHRGAISDCGSNGFKIMGR